MSAVPPVVLLLDDADTFKAVEGTCLRRDRCRLLKASFDDLREVASRSRPALILASCADAPARARATALCAEREISDVPVLLLDFAEAGRAGDRAWSPGGARRAPVEVLSARKRSGRPDFAELDTRLDAAVTRLVPQLLRRMDRLLVNLSVACNGAGLRSRLQTKDVSATGLFLKTDRPLTQGSRFGVSMQLDERQEITALCEVVRQVRSGEADLIPGIGVRFVDLEDSGREALRRFVSTRAHGARGGTRGTTRGSH